VATNWRPDLSDVQVVLSLKPREAAYFNILEYCRHIGVHVVSSHSSFWVARVRKRNGTYMQTRLCVASFNQVIVADFEQAKMLAKAWFASPEVSKVASDPYPLGSKRALNICPIGDVYSVGHALKAGPVWKLIAATKSHYETLVGLINYHLVPRISHVPLAQFTGENFQKLAVDVLETPPKFGRDDPKIRNKIQDLSQEELRKRKKTFNALVSVLRGSFEIAWEHGHLETDRSMRSLRRLPNVDRPRVVFLDRSECRSLLDASHPDLRVLILAALYTGCRANELTAMQVGDFSFQTKSVFVASPKGRKTRHVLLPPEGVDFFRRETVKRSSGERMFRKANGRIWGGEYRSYFLRARAEAGLPNSVTFHGLRHTYASQLLQQGASLLTVADQLGHANTQTVSATYGHLTSQSRADDINRCFVPIAPAGTDKSIVESEPETSASKVISLPLFKRSDESSWPRSNHSRFSGSLLEQIRPTEMD